MKKLIGIAALLAMAAAVCARADDKQKARQPSAEEKAMMEAWMKYSTPGEVHKKMASLEGTWTTKVREWMAPGAPPQESDGTAEFKMLLGGRYLQQSFQGSMMGQPFNGMGISGYDNAKKTTQSVWVDSAGTGMMTLSGSWDAEGKTLTETGSMDDFMTGKPMQIKGQMHMGDNDHFIYEMWMSGPDGKMFKTLDIGYTRKK
jgi:hypothetical protein